LETPVAEETSTAVMMAATKETLAIAKNSKDETTVVRTQQHQADTQHKRQLEQQRTPTTARTLQVVDTPLAHGMLITVGTSALAVTPTTADTQGAGFPVTLRNRFNYSNRRADNSTRDNWISEFSPLYCMFSSYVR
jgi:hypothetical protein